MRRGKKPYKMYGVDTARAPYGYRGVSSFSADASQIGLKILEYGGNALDAFIAVQIALEIFEPGWTGFGGGGFTLIHHLNTEEALFIDYRETAPRETCLEDALDQWSRGGPCLVGVPGLAAGIEELYDLKGVGIEPVFRPEELINRVVELVMRLIKPPSILLIRSLEIYESAKEKLETYSPRYFESIMKSYETGRPIDISNYVSFIKALGRDGWGDMYHGKTADKLLRSFDHLGIPIDRDDLEGYSVEYRRPIYFELDGIEYVSSPPPGGGAALKMLLHSMLESFESPYEYVEKLRETHIYREGIEDPRTGCGETAHITIYDGEAIVLSTTTLECFMGSGIYLDDLGILLNDELHDFNISGSRNRVAPCRRPRSSMSPTIAYLDGSILGLGASGGTRIITALATTLYQRIYRGINLQQAIEEARLHYEVRGEAYLYEPDPYIDRYIRVASRKGYILIDAPKNYPSPFKEDRSIQMGDVEAVEVVSRGAYFASDPRKGYGALTTS